MQQSQKYLAFIKLGSQGATPLYGEIMKWNQAPIKGVMLQEAAQMFGKWDFVVLFSADTNENALHFVGDVVRKVDGVVATKTIPIAPLRSWSQS